MNKDEWLKTFRPQFPERKEEKPKSDSEIGWLAEIGRALSIERKRRKFSQAEIAAALDINRSIISKIENGKHTGSLKPLLSYLSYFNLSLVVQNIRTTRLPPLGDNSFLEDD